MSVDILQPTEIVDRALTARQEEIAYAFRQSLGLTEPDPLGRGVGGHQSHDYGKDEWLTPPGILLALRSFDLDPCAPIKRPWDTARRHYTIEDDGLKKHWEGRVWCNPPYGYETGKWLARCAAHGNAIALVFARTETAMFFNHVWPKAHGLLFIEGRLHFHHVDGRRAAANGGAPSVLIAYGQANADTLRSCTIPGKFIELKASQ